MYLLFNILEPGNQNLPSLLLFTSNVSDDQYLILFVCGYHYLIFALLLV